MPPQEESPRYSGLEPRTRAFLEELQAAGGPPLYTLPPEQARAVLRRVQDVDVEAPMPAVDTVHRRVPGGPTAQVDVYVVRPKDVKGPLPPVVYLHGGGWVLGSLYTHDRLVRQLAVGCQAAVVFVDYGLAPESRYPVQLEQAYTVARWVSEHGNEADLDMRRLVLAGDSAGGNLVAGVTLLAKQRGLPHIDLQALFYPVTDANFDTPSYRAFADGFWLTREAMRWFWNQYAPPGAWGEPTASPLHASPDLLHGLPPALLFTAEYDVLRDEGEAYARKLIDAGISVTAQRYLGTIHDFMMLNALAETPAAMAATRQAILSIHEALFTGRGKEAPAGRAEAGAPAAHVH